MPQQPICLHRSTMILQCNMRLGSIELVKNFAAQAVIAIENTRLLDDLNKLNQQLERRVADQVSEIERMSRLHVSFLRK
jgi:hypothetical protein